MRALKHTSGTATDDIRRQVRETFRRHAREHDATAIKALLAEGKKQLVFVKGVALSAAGHPGTGTDAGAGDSWVGTGEKWDLRGRVGTSWPWSSGV